MDLSNRSSPDRARLVLHHLDDDRLLEAMDSFHRASCAAQRALFATIADADGRELWRHDGARDMPHWLWMRYGLSDWKSRRWLAASHAIEHLPAIADAFERGDIGIDKVVELTRFATPETERDLLRWAQGVSCGAIRRRGDLFTTQAAQATAEIERGRTLSWWYLDEGRRLGLEAELSAADGAVVVKALERVAATLPSMPDDFDPASARRADALVAVCAARIAGDPDRDRATVVIHAEHSVLSNGGGAEVEQGPVLPRASVDRLLCNARIQTILHGASGEVVGLGRTAREPSAWMVRQVRHRDKECRFPGCGARRFTEVHHIVFWRDGGRTDLDNLTLICSFHHKLVHEYGWRLRREPGGAVGWIRPDGRRYRAGPAPPLARAG